jgi:hypothetical protein
MGNGSDLLGSPTSTSITATTGGTHTRQLYTGWGEVRFSSGTLPTGYTYTGQYAYPVWGFSIPIRGISTLSFNSLI